jgi:heme/copper-type cytochrome/quinol oxidase subunit 4
MMNVVWFMRMKRWVQNPPSPQRVKFIFGIIVVAAVIFGLEYFGYWPEWLTAERMRRRF